MNLTSDLRFEEVDETECVVVHTDGSAYVRAGQAHGIGGWAFVAKWRTHYTHRFGPSGHGTTISEMELTAILRALQFLKLSPVPLIIRSDSQYAVSALTRWYDAWEQNGWVNSQGNTPAHLPLIRKARALAEMQASARPIMIEWIKGHAGHSGNEIADALASRARRTKQTNWNKHEDEKNKVSK